jgi:hypothetical protein
MSDPFYDGPITQKTLDDFANGFPANATPKNYQLHKDNDEVSFGTFRATLSDGNIYHKPDFINVFKSAIPLTPGNTRTYVACVVRVVARILIPVIADPNAPSMTQTLGKYELQEGQPTAPWNFFFLVEVNSPAEQLSIGREIKNENGEEVTYVAIAKGNPKAVQGN